MHASNCKHVTASQRFEQRSVNLATNSVSLSNFFPTCEPNAYNFNYHISAKSLRATAVPAGTAEARTSYGNSVRLSVCPSVCPSQPGGEPSPSQIETPGLHHMIA